MQTNQKDYLSYPKQFSPYKWYKPLLVTLVAGGFFFLFTMVNTLICTVIAANQGYDFQKLISGGYDNLDAYSALGAIMSLAGVAIMLPALAIGNRIINARPFSSYSSSRGGFRFPVFFKCFAASLIIVALPLVLITLFSGEKTGEIRFSVLGFILCTILAPLQCVAEEYIFRGHAMQMFGSWIKIPVIPIILQTLLFAAAHPYNNIGIVSVGIMGIVLGVCAYFTNGIESSSALHITNNLVAFYMSGFGFGSVQTNVDVTELIVTVIICCIYTAFIIFADKKLGWFDKSKKDDVSEFNAKIASKQR